MVGALCFKTHLPVHRYFAFWPQSAPQFLGRSFNSFKIDCFLGCCCQIECHYKKDNASCNLFFFFLQKKNQKKIKSMISKIDFKTASVLERKSPDVFKQYINNTVVLPGFQQMYIKITYSMVINLVQLPLKKKLWHFETKLTFLAINCYYLLNLLQFNYGNVKLDTVIKNLLFIVDICICYSSTWKFTGYRGKNKPHIRFTCVADKISIIHQTFIILQSYHKLEFDSQPDNYMKWRTFIII